MSIAGVNRRDERKWTTDEVSRVATFCQKS